jgi:uncharacterized membrane protein YdjX (TVP38/TMEM64 family)
MDEPAPRPSRALLVKLAVVAGVLLIAAALAARGLDLKGLLAQGLQLIRDAGPVAFFLGMALLPALGVPQSVFSLTAGPVFGPSLGIVTVIVLSVLALVTNMALSYFLARRALRPVLLKLFRRLGYQLPRVTPGAELDLIVLLRVTPGVPFPVQNYLLGLAEVPFGKYLLVSTLIQGPLNTAVILFGDAMLQGKGRTAFVAFSLLLALMAATQLLRKHYAKKRA